MAPAIALADGFPMYEFLRGYLQSERKASEPYEWSMRTYYPGRQDHPRRGDVPAAEPRGHVAGAGRRGGSRRRSGGATREQAIEAGRDAFYKGSIAQRMTAAVRAAGGVMTDDDLGDLPRQGRGARNGAVPRLHGPQGRLLEPGAGAAADVAHSRGLRSRQDGAGSADATHTIVEAVKLAYADRDRYYARSGFRPRSGDGIAVRGIRDRAPRADRSRARQSRAAAR